MKGSNHSHATSSFWVKTECSTNPCPTPSHSFLILSGDFLVSPGHGILGRVDGEQRCCRTIVTSQDEMRVNFELAQRAASPSELIANRAWRLVVRLWGRPAGACRPYRIKSNQKSQFLRGVDLAFSDRFKCDWFSKLNRFHIPGHT